MHGEGSLCQLSRIASSIHCKKELGKIALDACGIYVLASHVLLEDFQRSRIEWLGFNHPAGVTKEIGEVLQTYRKMRMIWAEDFFSTFDGFSKQAFCVVHFAIAPQDEREIAKPDEDLRMAAAG